MSADAPSNPLGSNEVEQIPDAHHPAGVGLIKPGYDPALTNEDLAPLHKQNWSSYNIFAFWMSDVHSVGGYLTAGSLFALGIAGWQVLIALLIGIVIVQIFVNLVAKPQPADRCALPGDQPGDLRGQGGQHPGDHPRAHRGRLVRRADLPRRRVAEHHLPEVPPREPGADRGRASSA